jgi:hypothetical protein
LSYGRKTDLSVFIVEDLLSFYFDMALGMMSVVMVAGCGFNDAVLKCAKNSPQQRRKASWCSWLSHVSNTHKVPRSSLGEVKLLKLPFLARRQNKIHTRLVGVRQARSLANEPFPVKRCIYLFSNGSDSVINCGGFFLLNGPPYTQPRYSFQFSSVSTRAAWTISSSRESRSAPDVPASSFATVRQPRSPRSGTQQNPGFQPAWRC